MRAGALLRRNTTTFHDATIYRACRVDAHNVVDHAKCLVALRNNIASTAKSSDLPQSREDLSLWMQAKRLFTEFVPNFDVDSSTKLPLDVGQSPKNPYINDENHRSVSNDNDLGLLSYSKMTSEMSSLKPVALPPILQNDMIRPAIDHRVTPSISPLVKSPNIRQGNSHAILSGGPIAARQLSHELFGEGDEEGSTSEQGIDYRRHRRQRKRRALDKDDRTVENKGAYRIDERYHNARNLERLNRYMEMRNFCGKFIQRMNAENSRSVYSNAFKSIICNRYEVRNNNKIEQNLHVFGPIRYQG